MSEHRLESHISHLVTEAKDYNDDQQKDRRRAYEYYDGIMHDTPTIAPDRSTVTSRDVRAAVKKLLPSIMRTFFGNDRVVTYSPEKPDHTEAAEAASKYVNRVVMEEAEVERAVRSAILDAMLVRTGILKWSACVKAEPVETEYTDLSIIELEQIEIPEDATISDHRETPETDPMIAMLMPEATRHSFTVRSIERTKKIMLEAIPRDSFLIMPGARSINESPLVGERKEISRSDLIAMGYDRNIIEGLPKADEPDDDSDSREGKDYEDEASAVRKAMEMVEVFDLYIRLDEDDDGIAELYNVMFVRGQSRDGSRTGHTILEMEQVSEIPYAPIKIEEEAFQFEGRSIFEDVEDIQRVKTVLQRETLDNIFATNAAQPIYDEDALGVEGVKALQEPVFGKPIGVSALGGRGIKDVVTWNVVPFVADRTFQMMQFKDAELEDRTGITDTSGGMTPEAMSGTSATAAQIMSDKGMAQTDMFVRTIKIGFEEALEGLLRLVIAHSEDPRTVPLDGDWQEFAPNEWPDNMRASVNIGLGAGSRERDMQALMMVKQAQAEIIAGLGVDNPYVTPDQVYNVLEKMTEAAGMPSATPYFTKPDPQDVQRRMQQSQNQPDPMMMKVQAQQQIEQMKQQTAQMKERAQMEADLMVKRAEIEARREADEAKLALQREQMQQKYDLELAKMEIGLVQSREQMAAQPIMPNAPVPDIIPGGYAQ